MYMKKINKDGAKKKPNSPFKRKFKKPNSLLLIERPNSLSKLESRNVRKRKSQYCKDTFTVELGR